MKCLFVILALVVILMVPLVAYCQSDAGFLEGAGRRQQWFCLHQDGTPWARTPYGGPDQYTLAVAWCEANGYTY
jgi:hypothetical protein